MQIRRWIVAALVAATLPLGTSSARADDEPDTLTPEAQAAALQKFEEGRLAYEADHFEAALAAFLVSIKLMPSPNSRLYIARCHRSLGKVASAFLSYRLSAREAHDRLVASGEKRYAATRNAATDEAAEIEARVPRVTVAVPAGLPAAFGVKVDGNVLARGAWGIAVETDPGSHEVEGSGPRLTRFRERFELREGENRRVEVAVERVPTALLSIKLATRPSGMALALDGEPVDPGQAEAKRELDPGVHRVVASAPGYASFRWEKPLADRDDATCTVKLEPALPPAPRAGGTPRWLFFTAAGASLLTLGTGAAFAVSAKNASSEEQRKPDILRDPDVQARIRSESTTANILFVSGGVLALGATVLFFTTGWKDSVVIAPTGTGVAAWGRF